MKNPSILATSLLVAAVITVSPLAYSQTASSAPDNNKTDGSASRSSTDGKSGLGDATTSGTLTSTGTISSDNKKDKAHPADQTDKTDSASNNDTSHQHSEKDQTKAAQANKNAPGD